MNGEQRQYLAYIIFVDFIPCVTDQGKSTSVGSDDGSFNFSVFVFQLNHSPVRPVKSSSESVDQLGRFTQILLE